MGKNKWYFLSKTPLLSSFLHFFKKNELFRRKMVPINIVPGEIKNLAKNRPKQKKGRAHFGKKWVKKGYFFGKKLHI
jgi:hypothetical protein